MSEIGRITLDPNKCGGRPCLRGLRIRVQDVLDLLAAGASRSEILADYPILEDGDISAALEYAARASDHPVLRAASDANDGRRGIVREPGLHGRHRDKGGEIHKKRSDTLVSTLRKEYGADFAKGYREDATLGTVLKRRAWIC